MEEAREEDNGEHLCKFLTLPTELLVIIFSFLPSTRDKVKIRYVSHRLRSVIETPSLWRTFMWPYYDDREELCINNVLKTCGKYVKKMTFPDHVTQSKLVKMLQQCSSVTHLSLPEGIAIRETELQEVVKQMEQLKYLTVHSWISIKSSLLIGANCKELTICISGGKCSFCYWVELWMENGFMPQNLSVVCADVSIIDVMLLIHDWTQRNTRYSVNHTATLRFYRSSFVPLNLIPLVPIFQLEYGSKAALPFTSVSKFGILGLNNDLLLMTDSCHGNNTVHKAVKMLKFQIDFLHCQLVDIKPLTCFEVTNCEEFYSGHLEQLAIACPNLQQLNIQSNLFCLKSLQGLRSIACYCKKLQGLNLLHISVRNVEDQVHLWEILSDMKLTHLAMDLCILRNDDAVKERMNYLFLQCSVLQALEMYNGGFSCSECKEFVREYLLQLSYFPMLSYCKLTMFPFQSTVVYDIVTNCNALKILYIDCSFHHSLPPSLTSLSRDCTLKWLCLRSHCAVASDEFMETVSAHGGLEHVIILAREITFGGIIALVKNSPMLITFRAAVGRAVEQDGIPNLMYLETSLMEMFPHRKLFTMGAYRVEEFDDEELKHPIHDLLSGTDLKSSLWPKSFFL